MQRRICGLMLAGLISVLWSPSVNSAAGAEKEFPSPSRWEQTIAKFEAQDRDARPPAGGVLFVGSSSIRLWNLHEHFPDLPAINRGFGGSHVEDSLYFADRIVLPYRPRAIVLYAGDNDIAAGKSPQRVLADYRALVKAVHQELPKATITFIAIKPSLKRWALIDKIREANALVRRAAEGDERLSFVDIDKPMLGDDGRPRKDLLAADGLHLSPAGYKLWSDLVRPHVTKEE